MKKAEYQLEVETSPEAIQAAVSDGKGFWMVGWVHRPGVIEFFEELERTHYPVDTDRNILLTVFWVPWETTHWLVIGVPKEDRSKAEALILKHKFRLVMGVPHVISFKLGESHAHFPFTSPDVFTIEGL